MMVENFEKTPSLRTVTEAKGLTLADAKLKDLPTPTSRVAVSDLTIVDDSVKPAMATYPPTQTYDRHRFLPPN
jgi:hypothetical protein